jgi:hypothetical protein
MSNTMSDKNIFKLLKAFKGIEANAWKTIYLSNSKPFQLSHYFLNTNKLIKTMRFLLNHPFQLQVRENMHCNKGQGNIIIETSLMQIRAFYFQSHSNNNYSSKKYSFAI